MKNIKHKLGLVALLSSLAGVTVADESEWVSLAKEGGQGIYGEKCGMCHRADGMGTFILGRRIEPERVFLEDRDDLQPDFVKTVVRNGFGLMFPMSRGEVSDEQLETIADYLAKEEQ